mgnify:CR=1 FL=1
MARTIRQVQLHQNARFGDSTAEAVDFDGTVGPVANTAGGVTRSATTARPTVRYVLTLTAAVVSMISTADFGSVKLVDLPNRKLLLKGCVVDLAVTIAGMTTQAVTSLTVAVGTVLTASTAFANAGEKNVVAALTGVGGTATGTVNGASLSAETNVIIAAGASNAVYLNASQPVTSGTGTATFTGTVELYFEDLGAA